jgi:hypothetical protein
MAQEEARAAELGIWGLSHAQQCQLADRGNGKRWSQMFVRSVILDDVYRPHAHEELRALLSPEVAARLDPARSHGIY